MTRPPNAYGTPMTPVTPAWVANSVRQPRLLPSAIEMTTPPQSIQRKYPSSSGEIVQNDPTSSNFEGAVPDAYITENDEGMPAYTPMVPQSNVPNQFSAFPINYPLKTEIRGMTRHIYSSGRVGKDKKVSFDSERYIQHIDSAHPGLTNPRNTEKDRYTAYNNYILKQGLEDKSKVVWSPEVEAAFMEALWLIPSDSRKILVEKRGRGRNELIADYLLLRLNARRTRKQVSSHLQVLKKLLSQDEEFLDIVGPRRSEDSSLMGGDKGNTEAESTVESIEDLIEKLRAIKEGKPKPAFLLQAEANLEESLLQCPPNSSPSYQENIQGFVQTYPGEYAFDPQQHPQQHQQSQNPLANPQHMQQQQIEMSISQAKQMAFANSHQYSIPQHEMPIMPHKVNGMHADQIPPEVYMQKEPPLAHPHPIHAQDLESKNCEYLIPPSASVPPEDYSIAETASPRRGHHHRRTTSRSVDFGNDQLYPVQFLMTRRVDNNSPSILTYTRLIRAAYSSPQHQIPLDAVIPRYPELAKMKQEGLLPGVNIVQATASLFVKPAVGAYCSEVQFSIASDQTNPLQHRYFVRTVISSRNKELLRCDTPCMFQPLINRPFEQDKELINVPFLADFWADFLSRLNDSSPEYTQAALSALVMFQAVYRVSSEGERLCFISLYQFNSVPDEFSARTRFRKVKSVPFDANTNVVIPQFKLEGVVPKQEHHDGLVSVEHIGNETEDSHSSTLTEPTTPPRFDGSSSQITNSTLIGEQTPRPLMSTILGMGTPGQTLGALMGCDTPSIFASPRRINQTEHLDLSTLPFPSALNSESRGSPRSSKFEIQRSMSAFEPSGWDDMQDLWIYK